MATVAKRDVESGGDTGSAEDRRHARRSLEGPPLRAMLRRRAPSRYRYHSCRVLDISATGVRLELPIAVPMEGTVWVRIEGLRLRDWCPATVMAVERAGEGMEVGLQFRLDEPDEPARST